MVLKKSLIVILTGAVLLTGCSTKAGSGAFWGATFGGLFGGSEGAVIGGVSGLAIGAYEDQQDKERYYRERYYQEYARKKTECMKTHSEKDCRNFK